MHIFFNKRSVFGSFSVLGQLLFVWIVTFSVGWMTVSLIRRFTQNGARCSSRGWWLMRLVVKAQFSFPLCTIPIVQTFHVAVALRRFLCKQRFIFDALAVGPQLVIVLSDQGHPRPHRQRSVSSANFTKWQSGWKHVPSSLLEDKKKEEE